MLPWTQFWYNSSMHHRLGLFPFKSLFGRDPPSVCAMKFIPIGTNETNAEKTNITEVYQKINFLIEKTNEWGTMFIYTRRVYTNRHNRKETEN